MKILIRFILLISLFLIPIKGTPCGFSLEGEDIRVYLFSPTAAEASDYTPFFYTSRFLNDRHYDVNQIPNENLDEWHSYFKEKVSKDAIKELVYNTSYEELNALSQSMMYNGNYLCNNELAEYIDNNGLVGVAQYLEFTKKTENLIYEADPWESKGFDIELINEHIQEGKRRINNENDKMLKQRYAYHIVVMMRYIGANQEAVNFFDEIFLSINSKDESIIKYWALSHVAFCQEQLDYKSEAHLNYARVFMNCHAKKNWVYNNLSKKSAVELLDVVKNDADKYAVYTFNEFKNPGRAYDGLKKIAEMNPNTDVFKTLMIREINKIEDWILTRRYTKYDPSIIHWSWNENKVSENYKSDFKYLEKFIGFVEKLLLNNEIENRGVYELMLAHLYFVHESPKMSLTYLNRAEKNINNPYEKHQLRMTRILIRVLFAEEYSAEFENLIWKDLKEMSEDNAYMQNRNKNISNLMLALQQAYHKEGEYDRATLFMVWASKQDWNDVDFRYWEYRDPFFYLDKFASVEQVKEFYSIYIGNNKTNLESFLLKDYDYSKNRYWDLIGTKYLRKDKLEQALEAYKKVPDGFWTKEFYYSEYLARDLFHPEYDAIFDNQEEDINTDFVNKAYLVNQLIQKKKAYKKARGIKRAERAFDLGNAYYNLSYNGSHWHCMAYIKSSSDYGYLGESDVEINDNYHTCNTALDYLKEAYEITKNAKYMTDEEHLMRQVIYATANIQTTEENKNISKHWKKCLAEVERQHPQFYKTMSQECAYIGD